MSSESDLPVGRIVAGLCGLCAAVIGVATVSLSWRACTAPVEGGVGVIERTFDSDNMVYNYEYFHRTAGEIRAQDAQVKSAQTAADVHDASLPKDRAAWDRDDRQESIRLHTIVTGLVNDRARRVEEYNAHARMANRSIFRSDDPSTPAHME